MNGPQIEDELEVAKPATKVTDIEEDMLETAVVANLILLFIAGFGTSSTMMTVCIYFLAKNPDVQGGRLNHGVTYQW